MKYNINEILDNTNGYIFYKSPNFDLNLQYTPCAITQLFKNFENIIYVPIDIVINEQRQNSFNNLEFLINKGISRFVFDEDKFEIKKYRDMLLDLLNRYNDKIDLVIMVKNTAKFIFDLANYTRHNKLSNNVKYIVVTGSVGKTTTTEMIASNLSKEYNVHGVGVNLRFRIYHKFIEAENDIDYCLFECSGAVKGYLEEISSFLSPTVAVITNIAPVHLTGNMGTIDIANRKSGIFTAMNEKSYAILNRDMEHFDIVASKAKINNINIITYGFSQSAQNRIEITNGEKFFIIENKKYKIKTELANHMLLNALASILTARIFNIPIETSIKSLLDFKSIRGRGNITNLIINNKKIRIIDEAVNANIVSMKAVLESYNSMNIPQINRVLVLGDMKEGGKDSIKYHLELEKYIENIKPDRIFLCGEIIETLYDVIKNKYNVFYCKNYTEVNYYIGKTIKNNDTILFKASHSVELDKTIKYLKDMEITEIPR